MRARPKGRVIGRTETWTERLNPSETRANLQVLEEATEEGWILSSGQVGELIGVVPRGEQFERHGFGFVQAGNVGAQCSWRVQKPSPAN